MGAHGGLIGHPYQEYVELCGNEEAIGKNL